MGPGPEVRERVLRVCRHALAERIAAERRREMQRAWGLAAAVTLLLLVNGVEERRHEARVASLMAGSARSTGNPPPVAWLLGSLRARNAHLAALVTEGEVSGLQERVP